MYNPTRRNRNIGTAKQGHGKSNRLKIPKPADVTLVFYEQLTRYKKTKMTINNHEFLFVVEETREDIQHACSINDIAEIIRLISPNDYGDLRLIILRQPTRKEYILAPVWGRFIYTYEFESEFEPAIILEAVDFSKPNKWGRHLVPEDMKELHRLRADGHEFSEDKRHYYIQYNLDSVRNTQLYRTLPHEFGHYVDYCNHVERPAIYNEDYNAWEQRCDDYFRIPVDDREKFAHRYAEKFCEKQRELGAIPFARIDD